MQNLVDDLKVLAEQVRTAADETNNLVRFTQRLRGCYSVVDYAIDSATGLTLGERIQQEIAVYHAQNADHLEPHIHLLNAVRHLTLAIEPAREHDRIAGLADSSRNDNATILSRHRRDYLQHAQQVGQELALLDEWYVERGQNSVLQTN